MKKIIASVVCVILLTMMLFGCNTATGSSNLPSTASSTVDMDNVPGMFSPSVSSDNASSSIEDDAIVVTLEQEMDKANLPHNIQVFNDDTIYVGIPISSEFDQEHLNNFNGYSKAQKLEVRQSIGWDSLVNRMQTVSDNIMKLIKDTKYNNAVLHIYNANDTSMTFLMYKNSVLVKDILAVN